MHNMKILIVAIIFMAVIWFTGIISKGDADVQMATIALSGLVLIWYVTKVIYCVCKHRG